MLAGQGASIAAAFGGEREISPSGVSIPGRFTEHLRAFPMLFLQLKKRDIIAALRRIDGRMDGTVCARDALSASSRVASFPSSPAAHVLFVSPHFTLHNHIDKVVGYVAPKSRRTSQSHRVPLLPSPRRQGLPLAMVPPPRRLAALPSVVYIVRVPRGVWVCFHYLLHSQPENISQFLLTSYTRW